MDVTCYYLKELMFFPCNCQSLSYLGSLVGIFTDINRASSMNFSVGVDVID
jgi:hypothetical protein